MSFDSAANPVLVYWWRFGSCLSDRELSVSQSIPSRKQMWLTVFAMQVQFVKHLVKLGFKGPILACATSNVAVDNLLQASKRHSDADVLKTVHEATPRCAGS